MDRLLAFISTLLPNLVPSSAEASATFLTDWLECSCKVRVIIYLCEAQYYVLECHGKEVFGNRLLLQRTRGKCLGALANQISLTAAGGLPPNFPIISSVAATNQVNHHFQKQAFSEQHTTVLC